MILVTLILAIELLNRKIGSPAVKTAEVSAAIREAVASSDDLQQQVAENEQTIDRIREALSAGQENLREVAPFDIRRIEDQLKDLQHVNEDLEKNNHELAQEVAKSDQRKVRARVVAQEHKDDSKTAQQLKQEAEKKKKELQKLKLSNTVIYNAADGDSKNAWLVEITAGQIGAGPMDRSKPAQTFKSVDSFKTWAFKRNKATEYFVLTVKPDGISNFQDVQQLLRSGGFDLGYDLLARDQNAVESAATGGKP